MTEQNAINGNLEIEAYADTRLMPWTASPSGTVWRKRVHLVGPPESGQVTSVVRYLENASFPFHDHPQGEEIYVIEGTFSDDQGDWPAGSYLLNPEGFRHAPFSRAGCELLVKLRQYPGSDRQHVAINVHSMPWLPGGRSGESEKLLYRQPGYSDITRLLRWDSNTELPLTAEQGMEIFVLDGELSLAGRSLQSGCWFRIPAGQKEEAKSTRGCTFYCKENGLPYLAQA